MGLRTVLYFVTERWDGVMDMEYGMALLCFARSVVWHG